MLPWPPYSPDLSPIEHVWDIIGRRLHALPQPRSEDELWQMVEREWRAIPQDAIRTLIDSLPRRVAAKERRTDVFDRIHLSAPRADRQIVRMAVTDRSVTSRTVAQHIQSVTQHPVYHSTLFTVERSIRKTSIASSTLGAEPPTSTPPMLRLKKDVNGRME
ncbi:hypothetical protein LAZ67_1007077 [Cordylochernes scorpioides]|uniref:Transposase n=1 Tax=Cordylochernes scorpioides TaxID=51811 RepID=A0ABY6JZG9_9ARAC|nr:hypothetical protein LAZ67_1007077 [Cordylochernes scorpioides]